jgi:periplasmic glucans biosynthesis protein
VVPEPVLSTSRGAFASYKLVEAVPDGVNGHWRVQFDLAVGAMDPVELRCFLQANGETLTETWMFQYHPF